ncbi:MAG: type IX secretion system outer membrane channel protein PorV [Bacteroidales bacterium]
MRSVSRRLLCHSLAGTIFILSGISQPATGQVLSGPLTLSSLNNIPTSVPFLTIAPDGRATGMGDVGAASAPDLHSQHWNVAKYVFLEEKGGVGMTYTSWVPEVLPDVALIYAAGAYRINDRNALSGSFRYFYLGTYLQGPVPREWALDVGYSRKITENFSGGIVLRYIRSELTDAPDAQTGTSLAGDLGLYYHKSFLIGEKEAQWAAGLSLSNLGPRVSYTPDAEGLPIPSTIRIGGRFGIDLNPDHAIDFHFDLNKLMVPTPPVYERDSLTGERVIIRGMAPPESVVMGMIQSFYDAPGYPKENGIHSVVAEEFHEITLGTGIEYRFRSLLAVRTGYFHEHVTKGNRKYFTFGLGSSYRFLALDVSYLLPVDTNSYLKNVFRVTLKFFL